MLTVDPTHRAKASDILNLLSDIHVPLDNPESSQIENPPPQFEIKADSSKYEHHLLER